MITERIGRLDDADRSARRERGVPSPLRWVVMAALAVVSALATLVPAVLSGYFRYRAPTENAGIVLFAVAIVSGLLFVAVRSGLWGVLIPQLALDGAATAWGVQRLRAIGVNG